jgi:predicted RNA-binding Zn-ribbon protein involved in translation (DUF1610 family)
MKTVTMNLCDVHGRFKKDYYYCPYCGKSLKIKKQITRKSLLEPYKCNENECEFYIPRKNHYDNGYCSKHTYPLGGEKQPRSYQDMLLCHDYSEKINAILSGKEIQYEE